LGLNLDNYQKEFTQSFKKQGFFLTSFKKMFNFAQNNSVWPLEFGLSCCLAELMQVKSSKYNFNTQNVVFQSSPRHADLLIISGTLTNKAAFVLRKIYDQMAEPKKVIAFGACSCGGGIYNEGYAVVNAADKIIPVDIYVKGCPPKPESLLAALEKLKEKNKE
jgi:NADH-quinone oxidoreductase subunit B